MELIGEFDLRQATKEMLRSRMNGHANARIYEEMCIPEGTARIDLALVTDRLHGFELKSDFDTCKRLASQIEAYNTVFDTMSIITGPTLANEVSAMTPNWWGLGWAHRNADHGVTLRWLRHPRPNPSRSTLGLAQFLWREEASELLAMHTTEPISKRATRAQLQTQLVQHMDTDSMRSAVINFLCKRPLATRARGARITSNLSQIDLDPDWLYPELYGPAPHAHNTYAQVA